MSPATPLSQIVVINDLSHPMGGASALAVASVRSFAARGCPPSAPMAQI